MPEKSPKWQDENKTKVGTLELKAYIPTIKRYKSKENYWRNNNENKEQENWLLFLVKFQNLSKK